MNQDIHGKTCSLFIVYIRAPPVVLMLKATHWRHVTEELSNTVYMDHNIRNSSSSSSSSKKLKSGRCPSTPPNVR